MRLAVDGVIFQKDPHGGIARLFRETLPRICDLAPDLQITLFFDGPLSSEPPVHSRIQVKRAPAIKRTLRVQGTWRNLIYPFRRLSSWVWRYARQFWLNEERDAIWHSTYYTLPVNWNGPQIVTVHDLIHEQFPQFFDDSLDDFARRTKKRSIEQASAVICVSESTRQQVERFYRPESSRIRVIPNAYNPIFRCLAPPVEPIDGLPLLPFLLYVGKRVHYKNYSTLLDGYSRWHGKSAAALVVIGEPWSVAEQQHLGATGLAQQVHLFSRVDDATLCRLYNLALALVFPSLEEGFGIPLLEAMACGCPIVASRIPSTLEVAADCPIYFSTRQPATLLAALDQALLEGRSSGRVAAGLERVKRYSWDFTAQQTLEVYREVWQAEEKIDGNA